MLAILILGFTSIASGSIRSLTNGQTRLEGTFKATAKYEVGNWTGAINDMSVVPNTKGNNVFVAAINGGIYYTQNFQDAVPDYKRLHIISENQLGIPSDFSPSTSTVYVDQKQPNLVTVGSGAHSSWGRESSRLTGVAQSDDGGENWHTIFLPKAHETNVNKVRTKGDITLACAGATPANQEQKPRFQKTAGLYVSIGREPFERVSHGSCFDLIVDGDYMFALFETGLARSLDGLQWDSVTIKGDDHLVRGKMDIQHAPEPILIAFRTVSKGPGEFIYWTDPFGDLKNFKQNIAFSNSAGDGVLSSQGSIHGAIAAHPTKPFIVYFAATTFGPAFQDLHLKGLWVAFTVVGDIRKPTEWKLVVTPKGAMHADVRQMMTSEGHLIAATDGGVFQGPLNDDQQPIVFVSKAGTQSHWEVVAMGYDPATKSGVLATQDNSCVIGNFGKYSILNGNGDGGTAAVINFGNFTAYLASAQQMGGASLSWDDFIKFANVYPYFPKEIAYWVTYAGSDAQNKEIVLPNKKGLEYWGNYNNAFGRHYCPVPQLQNKNGFPRPVYADHSRTVYLSISNKIYEVTAPPECRVTEVVSLGDYTISSFCIDPKIKNRFFILTEERISFVVHGKNITAIQQPAKKVQECQWTTIEFQEEEVGIWLLATSNGVYAAPESRSVEVEWLQLRLGLEAPNCYAMTIRLNQDSLAIGFLGTGAFVLDNFTAHVKQDIMFNVEVQMEAQGIDLFQPWYPVAAQSRDITDGQRLIFTFPEKIEVIWTFVIFDSATFEVIESETYSDEEYLIVEITDKMPDDGASHLYTVASVPGCVVSAANRAVGLVGNFDEKSIDLQDLMIIGRFSTGSRSNGDARAEPPHSVTIAKTEIPKELFVTWEFNEDDLEGCVFARWLIYLTMINPSLNIEQRLVPAAEGNLWDINLRNATVIKLSTYNSYKAEVQVQCLEDFNDSPLSSLSEAAKPQSPPADPCPSVRGTGVTDGTLGIKWEYGNQYACKFVRWEVQLRDPSTKEGFNTCSTSDLTNLLTAKCTAEGLQPNTNYFWARVRQICTDPTLNSDWAYTNGMPDTWEDYNLLTTTGPDPCKDKCGTNTACENGVCVGSCKVDACCTSGLVCLNKSIMECVGKFDPFCRKGWDEQCVEEAQDRCGLQC